VVAGASNIRGAKRKPPMMARQAGFSERWRGLIVLGRPAGSTWPRYSRATTTDLRGADADAGRLFWPRLKMPGAHAQSRQLRVEPTALIDLFLQDGNRSRFPKRL
jgi:hypothetical protein